MTERYGDRDFIELDLDVRGFLAGLDELTERQLPFALSLATNRVAFDARDALRESLGKRFIIRNRWVSRRTVVRKGNKRDPTAIVGHLEPYMRLHALGGYKDPDTGRLLPVPVRVRRPLTVKTTISKWPESIIRKRRTTILEHAGGGAGLYQIRGREQSLSLLYLLVGRARIEPKWPFQRTVEHAVGSSWPNRAVEALREALATAKRKGKR